MTDTQHVDHQVLAGLREVMEGDFGLLLETFLSDAEARISNLQRALVEADADGARRAAHSFKGSCSNIGALELVRRCQSIESAAAAGELTGLECQLVELLAEFNQVKWQLDTYR